MKLRTKAWLVSQGLLIITACIIQFTFHREIKVGPLLKTNTRDYWDIINKVEPQVPQFLIDLKLSPELYDARLPMTSDQVLARNLVAHRRAVRQEDGLRTALIGSAVVNILYFIGFHFLYFYIRRTLQRGARVTIVSKKVDI